MLSVECILATLSTHISNNFKLHKRKASSPLFRQFDPSHTLFKKKCHSLDAGVILKVFVSIGLTAVHTSFSLPINTSWQYSIWLRSSLYLTNVIISPFSKTTGSVEMEFKIAKTKNSGFGKLTIACNRNNHQYLYTISEKLE